MLKEWESEKEKRRKPTEKLAMEPELIPIGNSRRWYRTHLRIAPPKCKEVMGWGVSTKFLIS